MKITQVSGAPMAVQELTGFGKLAHLVIMMMMMMSTSV